MGSRSYINRLKELTDLPDITLNGIIIEPRDSLKVLGITLDSTLSWREQSNTTARNCFGVLARLRKCHGYLPQNTKLTLVKTLVFPHLYYCAGIFLDLSKELTLKLARCKNAALRFVTGTRIFEHITPVYREKEILTYAARRDFVAICLLASILRSHSPRYLAEKVSFKEPVREGSLRRSPLDLNIRKFSLEIQRGSFCVTAPYLWNDIPEALRKLCMRPSFKTALFKCFFGCEHYV